MGTEKVLDFIKNIKQIERNYKNSGGSFTNEMLKEFVKEACENFCQVDLQVSDAKGDPIRATLNIELEIPDYEKVLLRAKEWMIKHKYKYTEDETCSLITDYLMSDINIGYGIINQELYIGKDASPLSR